jgi:SAM-dependent methyltransferase
MSPANEYKRQFDWREWTAILDALPSLQGRTVLDLGCGVGDLAAELVARGARVIGVDFNEELLREARSLQLPNAEFRTGDLRTFPDLGVEADGIWCSFAAAYFPDLPKALRGWARHLKPGGWIALTEIDDLFGHEPLGARTRESFSAHAENALAAGRYDFHMGRKLRGYLEGCGFTVSKTLTLGDRELSFSGPAGPEVLDAWRARFNRMNVGSDLQHEFLGCLQRADHASLAKVCCCIAIKGQGG